MERGIESQRGKVIVDPLSGHMDLVVERIAVRQIDRGVGARNRIYPREHPQVRVVLLQGSLIDDVLSLVCCHAADEQAGEGQTQRCGQN